MKVLVINCGSSSLKYQLIDMDGEKVLCKGLCERIGMESSMITHEANGHKATTPAIFPTHTEAFAEVVKKMTTGEGKCINDVSEIDAIGHRVVHGGEKFKSSCLITDEVIETLRELSPLAPLHNPAGILGIEAARKVFGNIPMVAVFDTAFHSTMHLIQGGGAQYKLTIILGVGQIMLLAKLLQRHFFSQQIKCAVDPARSSTFML